MAGNERSFGGALVLALAPLLLATCESSRMPPEAIRSTMRAADQGDLLECLGPPHDLRIEAGTSYFLYRLDFRPRESALEPTGRTLPVLCEAVFALDEGEISDVVVRGYTREGLNADARCTVVVGSCFVDSYSGEARVTQPSGLRTEE